MAQPVGKHLASIDENNQLNQQQPIILPVVSNATAHPVRPPKAVLPRSDLINGSRENYLKIGVPLYEASIKCDWKAAKAIIDKQPELVRYSITENGETALHVAASAKGPKNVEEFVTNLVNIMERGDLELQNENHNTALYLAAAALNVKAVKIMVEKNSGLLIMAGSKGTMMPLYAAALFGNYDVVKYMYDKSKGLSDDGWTPQNRGWLLLKCVENDMFDIALQIVKRYPELGTGNVLIVLARKPDAFPETESNIIRRIINSALIHIGCGSVLEALDRKLESYSQTKFGCNMIIINMVFDFFFAKTVASEKERNAMQLLRLIWEDIAKKPKDQIDRILRGPADPIKHDKSASGRVVQAMQLENLISEHITKMKAESQNIIGRQQDTQSAASVKIEQALLLQQLISKHLINMHVEIQNIMIDLNKPVSGKSDQALELQKLISEYIVNMHNEVHNLTRGPSASGKEDQAYHLQSLISKHNTKLHLETQKFINRGPAVTPSKLTYSSRILFVAAETGNTNFLVELIRRYPDLIWKVNDNNQTIFHIAIKHRHEGIYNLLYEIGAMKDLITPLRDGHENNMLHLVGKSAKKKKLEKVSGVALQMQRELLWFKEVETMIPPSYRDRKNEDDLTPHELFTKEHKELVSQGEKWMKGTSSQCMVVAALIATIVFAAAFTVPGGYGQSDPGMGKPVFDSKAPFIVFVVADAISLFSSSASILMFLSILTSRYAERDFLESLPKKLMLGLATLFLSITTMTVAFSVSFFVLYHNGLLWIPCVIAGFAVMPVLLYAYLQRGLFVDVIRSTYGSRYLFKPKKHVLYYKNPRF